MEPKKMCDCGHEEYASEVVTIDGHTVCRDCRDAYLEYGMQPKPKVDDGGNSYPSEQGQVDGLWNQTYDPGISRRDWLAGLAMEGLIGSFVDSFEPGWEVAVAREAYLAADAMIDVSKKK
jgi:hypothetical protein